MKSEIESTAFSLNKTINVNGRLVDLSTPSVMGILNLTPDSFYDGGKHRSEKEILNHTEKMLTDGATFIDIGGLSTRPSTKLMVDSQEEIRRIASSIGNIVKYFPQVIISVDTFRADVAEVALDAGASIINDISAGTMDPHLPALVAQRKVPYIIMHMQGDFETMHHAYTYQHIALDVATFLSGRLAELINLAIKDIIVDPGFGFSKSKEQGFELLSHLEQLKLLERPILVGFSRKSMVWKSIVSTPAESLNGTTVLNTIALLKRASILRVHDVKEAMEVITLVGLMDKG